MNAPDIVNDRTTEEFFTSPELSGKLRFAVIDRSGDTKYMWDSTQPAEVEVARAAFDKLRAEGYDAFRVTDRKGEAGEMVHTFDPSHERLLFTPRMEGG